MENIRLKILVLRIIVAWSFSNTLDETCKISPESPENPIFPCNIIQYEMFPENFALCAPDRPAIFRFNVSTRNFNLRKLASEENLRRNFGDEIVLLSTSNSFSHRKKSMLLRDIFEYSRNEDLSSSSSNSTYYLFGDNTGGIWKRMLDLYDVPPSKSTLGGTTTIGIGGRHSGVSFHFHGPGFSEIIIGRKRWFLFPPNEHILGNEYADMSPRRWVDEVYPQLLQNKSTSLYECVIHPGEMIYFPDKWLHGTLNLDDYNFFVSYFLENSVL